MKKYNDFIMAAVIAYFIFAGLIFVIVRQRDVQADMSYKVEVHEIMRKLEQGMEAAEIQNITFLPVNDRENLEALADFYEGVNGMHSCIKPLIIGQTLKGYVRFDYVIETQTSRVLWLVEGILLFVFGCILALLFYIQRQILQPFHRISEMPYELSRGNLQVDLEENKNRLFGRFLWGLTMLRDTLNDSKAKELRLLKEKKLLLLSISHDIKIPLSAVKLYAKALKEDIYDTNQKRREAAEKIEAHAGEIEAFVKEIVSASSEEIIAIEVENADFYLKDFVEKIREVYQPKAQVTLLELEIGEYKNKMLKGDMNRAFEVVENLMDNAFKYGDGRSIVIDFYEEDYCQIVRIFNTGAVIPLSEMPHLFDSFYRASNASDKPGNGLGLYISRQIMNKMEGEIFAERKEDGMSFGIVFRL